MPGTQQCSYRMAFFLESFSHFTLIKELLREKIQ